MPPFVSLRGMSRGTEPGFLGIAHRPFTPSSGGKQNLRLATGVTAERLDDRKQLLDYFDDTRRDIDATGAMAGMDAYTEKAIEMVTSGVVRDALDLQQGGPGRPRPVQGHRAVPHRPPAGRGRRRLRHARPSAAGTPTANVLSSLKKQLPQVDRAIANLIQDLHDRGMQDDVVTVMWGEFGRTPKVNMSAGRDHWSPVMCALVAGGGLKMGQAVGARTAKGERPKDRPYTVPQVLSTLYRAMGIDPAMTFKNGSGRPMYVLDDREAGPRADRLNRIRPCKGRSVSQSRAKPWASGAGVNAGPGVRNGAVRDPEESPGLCPGLTERPLQGREHQPPPDAPSRRPPRSPWGRHMTRLLAALVLLGFGGPASAADVGALSAFPPALKLRGLDDAPQLVLTGQRSDGRAVDLTAAVTFAVSDPKVVRVTAEGRVLPLANGAADGHGDVRGPRRPGAGHGRARWTRRCRSTSATRSCPIFTKLGCNSGGCHGKIQGQNGFRLSLLGFDPELDYTTLLKEARGRRIFPAAPDTQPAAAQGHRHRRPRRRQEDRGGLRGVPASSAAGSPPALPFGSPKDPDRHPHQRHARDRASLDRQARQQLAVQRTTPTAPSRT